MTHADDEARVLRECYQRTQEVRSRPRPPEYRTWQVAALEDELTNGPRYSTVEWFEAHTEAARVRMLRAVNRLAGAGLVTRVMTGNRLTHLRLTEEGERAAAALVAADPTGTHRT